MPDGTTQKQRTGKQAAARRKAIKDRLSSGSRKLRTENKGEEQDGNNKRAAAEHAEKIAAFHALEKRIARAQGAEREKLLEEQSALGGLESYQEASITGAKHGETSRWLVQELGKIRGRQPTKLLDVGAIAGTAYKKYRSIDATYIDLNPQAPHVEQADFLDIQRSDTLYDVVCLSLVVNFVGDLPKRTQMLRHAHNLLKEDGFLYLVLPLACLTNSRYMDQERFSGILQTLGWSTMAQHNSALLTHWMLQRTEGDLQKWTRKEVRGGVGRNNFVIIVK